MNKINCLYVFLALLLTAQTGYAQSWPARTVRIIVPYAAGPELCGETITLGRFHNGDSAGNGSCANTSR